MELLPKSKWKILITLLSETDFKSFKTKKLNRKNLLYHKIILMLHKRKLAYICAANI